MDSLLLNCSGEFRIKVLQAKYLSLPSPTEGPFPLQWTGMLPLPLGTGYWSITGYLRHFFRFSLNVYRYQFILLGRMGLYESELSCPRIQYNHPSRARRQTISSKIQRATYKATAPSAMHLIWSNTNFMRNDVYKGWDLVKMPWKKLEWWIDRRRYLEQTLKKEAEKHVLPDKFWITS